jgi:hypothetical protein
LKFQINYLISKNATLTDGTMFGQFIAKWIIQERFYRRKFFWGRQPTPNSIVLKKTQLSARVLERKCQTCLLE